MGEHMPLIPKKGYQLSGSICEDVRCALRRMLPVAVPPPLKPPSPPIVLPLPTKDHCVFHETAERLREARAKETLARNAEEFGEAWKTLKICNCVQDLCSCDFVTRNDVLPAIGSGQLWVRAALKCRQNEVVAEDDVCLRPLSIPRPPAELDDGISFGRKRKTRRTARVSAPPPAPSLTKSSTVLVVPSHIDFINCHDGVQYTRLLRIINTGRAKTRVSISPFTRPELQVSLTNGLRVTSGAACALRVHCTPRNVRAFCEVLQVRVAGQGDWSVPIRCYTEGPRLQIHAGGVTSSGGHGPQSATVLDLGANLLGNVHCTKLQLRCDKRHAAYWLLSEDAWLDSQVTAIGKTAKVDDFIIYPGRWQGGKRTAGHAWCIAQSPGLQTATLRILCNVATVRTLHVIADSLMHGPKNVVLKASEKVYDIFTEDDPAMYYVYLEPSITGARGARTELCICNNSPVKYKYSWDRREWEGWQTMEDPSRVEQGIEDMDAVSITPEIGEMEPRSCTSLQIKVPPSNKIPGIHRAVLRLLLHDIPRDSIVPELIHTIIGEREVDAEYVPEIPRWTKTLCTVILGELEVWWRVNTPSLVLEPLCIAIPHSRRIQKIALSLKGTLIPNDIRAYRASFTSPEPIEIDLPPGESPAEDIILSYDGIGRCNATAQILRYSDPRHPSLSPAFAWLGVVPPKTDIAASLLVSNDTFEQIDLKSKAIHWTGSPKDAECIAGAAVHCPECHQHVCHCTVLLPRSTRLRVNSQGKLEFKTRVASSGPDLWLAVAKRSSGDEATMEFEAPVHARAALLACRVLAPQLVLRILKKETEDEREGELPCISSQLHQNSFPCQACKSTLQQVPLDGSPLLRPIAALGRGRRSQYRLVLKNLTPQSTKLSWEPCPDKEPDIKITFFSNEIEISGHATVEMKVEVEGMAVCGRKITARRGIVRNGSPIYLLCDATCEGEAICLELPDGRMLRRTEVDLHPGSIKHHDDLNVKDLHQIYSELYLRRDDEIGVDDVCTCEDPEECECADTSPHPGLRINKRIDRHCSCTGMCYCAPALQFPALPVHTESVQEVRLHNSGPTCISWRVQCTVPVLRGVHGRRAEGLHVRASPTGGWLARGESIQLHVYVLADWGGPHRAFITVKSEHCTLQMHVWVGAVGEPLLLISTPAAPSCEEGVKAAEYRIRMVEADPLRCVRARNVSGTALCLRAYIVREHENIKDKLPFRLMYRLYDVPVSSPPTPCLCEEGTIPPAPVYDEVKTGVELFIAPDYGYQDHEAYEVQPEYSLMEAASEGSWYIRLGNSPILRHLLVLCITPPDIWRVSHGAAGSMHVPLLRHAVEPMLLVSQKCVKMEICALKLPAKDVTRIRKTLIVRNIGMKKLPLKLCTEAPWRVREKAQGAGDHVQRKLNLGLPPLASIEITVEIEIETTAIWPRTSSCVCESPQSISILADHEASKELTSPTCAPFQNAEDPPVIPLTSPADSKTTKTSTLESSKQSSDPHCLCYSNRHTIRGELTIQSGDEVLQKLPLSLLIRIPSLRIQPLVLSFGKVAIKESACDYLTISHNALYTLELLVELTGQGFTLNPNKLLIPARGSGRVYVRFTAGDSARSAKGRVEVRVKGEAGSWCRGEAWLRVCVTRDMDAHRPPHDFTDDPYL